MLVPTYLHRQFLKKPLGVLYKNDSIWELKEVLSKSNIITIGDVVTSSFIKYVGKIPEISVVDGKTRRNDVPSIDIESLQKKFDNIIKINNPQGSISLSFIYNELAEGLIGFPEEKTLIIVEGEEDMVLLSLLKIMSKHERVIVLYGQPGEGVVMINLDDDIMLRTSWIMQTMDQVIPPLQPPASLIKMSRDIGYGENECR